MDQNEQKVFYKLLDALINAEAHLDYCGYGDSYERSGAIESKLPQQIEEAIAEANKLKNFAKNNLFN